MSNHIVNLEELASIASFSSRMLRATGAVIGRIVGVADNGLPLVEFDGNEGVPLAARYVAPISTEALASLAERRQEVLLDFLNDDAERPVISGLLQPVALNARGQAPVDGPPSLPETVVVDGQRIRIEGKDEIVLSCGAASITLRRNGRVVIRGTHLESDSLGANWIRGADIQVG